MLNAMDMGSFDTISSGRPGNLEILLLQMRLVEGLFSVKKREGMIHR